jgi:acetyl esterase/lipase
VRRESKSQDACGRAGISVIRFVDRAKRGEALSRFIIYIVCAAGLAAGALIAQENYSWQCHESWPLTSGAQTIKTFGDTSIVVNVFKPDAWSANDKRPVIVYFFGGGFYKICVEAFGPLRDMYLARGFVVVMAEYRRALCNWDNWAPIRCIEDYCLPDAKSAMRWTRAHASELGADPDKIIAMGSSAGGHLAASTVLLDGYENSGENLDISCKPNLLILLWPVLDLTAGEGAQFRRYTHDQPAMSPALHLDSDLVPTQICIGSEDQFYDGVQKFMSEAGKLSLDVRLDVYDGGLHDFGYRSDKRWHSRGEDSTIVWTDRFLKAQGFMPAQSSSNINRGKPHQRAIASQLHNASGKYELRGRFISAETADKMPTGLLCPNVYIIKQNDAAKKRAINAYR